MNKPVDPKYYVDASTKVELKAKFLKLFANLMLNKKYNHVYVKAFYFNLVQTLGGIESRFKDKTIRFNYMDFTKYLILTFEGSNMSVARSSDDDKVSFVLSITKFICNNHAMSNFDISQVEFDIRQLNLIIVKIPYKKPKNWGKIDDNDLYLIWALMTDKRVNWVKFIVDRMLHCRDNPKKPLFSSSFVALILEVNGSVSNKVDLVEAPKVLDYSRVSKMRYYGESNGDYYYLDESGQKVYDNKISELVKDPSNKAT